MNEEKNKMSKMIKKMEKYADIPKAIKLEVHYNQELQKITGIASEPVFMSEWSTLVYLLHNIFMAHPNIEKKYPPGKLDITINGIPPTLPSTPLFDGNIIELSTS